MQTICRGDRSPYLGMFAQIKRVLLLIADILSIFSTCLQSISSVYCENCGSWFLQRTQITDHGSKKWHFQPHTPGFGMKKNRLINILKNRNSENHLFLTCHCRTCRNVSVLTGFKPCCLVGQVFGGNLMT